jgi:hypothetical protein
VNWRENGKYVLDKDDLDNDEAETTFPMIHP